MITFIQNTKLVKHINKISSNKGNITKKVVLKK